MSLQKKAIIDLNELILSHSTTMQCSRMLKEMRDKYGLFGYPLPLFNCKDIKFGYCSFVSFKFFFRGLDMG
ncbi:MAG: hypothetical protein ACFFHV_16875 [Promethearchaeota archaeon]